MKDLEQQLTSAYQAHANALLRYCSLKVNSPEVAEDLIQETFLRAWRSIRQGTEVSNLKAFLYQILRNLIVDNYRSRANDTSLDTLQEEGFEPESVQVDDIERWVDCLDGNIALKLLETMNAPYRDVLLMKYMQDKSLEQIAKITHASKNAVTVRVHRGLAMLQKLFVHNMVY